ncbi:MAG: HEAT repeat domain-containing protein [Gaiellaceae bacterium]
MGLSKPNIAKLRKQRDVPRLIKALDRRELEIRIAAAEALGEVGDSRAVRPLLRALESPGFDPGFMTPGWWAANALRRLAEPAFFRFTPSEYHELERDPERSGVLELVRSGGYVVRVLEPEEASALERELREAGVEVVLARWAGVSIEPTSAPLDAAGSPSVTEPGEASTGHLIEALASPDFNVRWRAVIDLGNRGDPLAVAPLGEMLFREESFLMVREAADALGKIDGEDAFRQLYRGLHYRRLSPGGGRGLVEAEWRESGATIRDAAEDGLVLFGPAVVDLLLHRLAVGENGGETVAWEAVSQVIARIGSEAIDPLLSFPVGDSRVLRETIDAALEALGYR